MERRRQSQDLYRTACHNKSRGDLHSRRRATHPEAGHVMPHAHSRHADYGANLRYENGNVFGQGGKFPKHIRPGDITRIRTIVYNAWRYFCHGRSLPQNRVDIVAAYGDGAVRIAVQINMFGLTRVDAIVTHNAGVHTVFQPYEDMR